MQALYNEHARLTDALKATVIGYQCPTCMVEITAENIDAVKADYRKRLAVLIQDGRTAKQNLADVKAEDSSTRDGFGKQKSDALVVENDKLAELNQQLQELNVSRELDREDYGEHLTALEGQIDDQEYRLTNGNWTHEQILRFTELALARKGYEAQIEALSEISTDDGYTALIAETEGKVVSMKRLINEAIIYMAKRVELMLDGLKMNNTEIVLTEIVKSTGELKDCFRFSYDGRDYRMLSLSEKVRAGLEVATMLQRLAGRNYPIFVDNGESICTFGNVNITSQVILSRVVAKQPLKVEYRSREQAKMAA